MIREQLLLVLAMEECDELSQRLSKAIRFGLDEIQKDQELNNSDRILYEFNDLLATIELIYDCTIRELIDDAAIVGKKVKIERYLEYSKQLGKYE